ncbi:hypothetical protein L596_016738 [Steinernema carpocapsae]|uniref:Uncharacterized protein n=1 Tax=Steinernema carpocapsae TaxID=34508 RepID=A0A4U5NJZ8_STECR|nr:hypothetical protein L596_016738 [Steinernema carpocapsae]
MVDAHFGGISRVESVRNVRLMRKTANSSCEAFYNTIMRLSIVSPLKIPDVKRCTTSPLDLLPDLVCN